MITLTAASMQTYQSKPWLFLEDLVIESDGVPARFGDVMDPWQRADFARVLPGMMVACGLRPRTGVDAVDSAAMRTWLERPRGHSKTSDIAALVAWALCFAPRVVTGIAAAADQDQARTIGKSVARIVQLNPALKSIIEVQRNAVKNVANGHPAEGSTLEIISNDAGSSFGALVDFAIADEVSHWGQDRSLWDSILSTIAKRSTAMLLAITNAGWTGTWQYTVREIVRQSERWHFASLDGPQARWITPAILDEQKGILPPTTYRRLWLNQWVTATDRPLLTEALILACVDKTCLWPAGIAPEFGRHARRHWRELFIGVDIGRTKDRTVITTTERDDAGVHHVREMYVMRGERFASQRAAIEWRIDSNRPYVRAVRVDRGGIGMQLTEELETKYPGLVEGVSLHESMQGRMAVAVKSAFERGLVKVPDDRELFDDLQLVEEVDTGASGVPKVRTNRGPSGHADRFWSLTLALTAEPVDWQTARPVAGMPVGVAPIVASADMQRLDPRNPMAGFVGSGGQFNGLPTTLSMPFYFGG